MTRIDIERTIVADPTSTALVLAQAGWPACSAATRAARARIHALPPLRLSDSFVTPFELTGDGLPPTTGVLTLDGQPVGLPGRCTTALLRLEFAAPGTGGAPERRRILAALRGLGESFLDDLATAAERRAYAA